MSLVLSLLGPQLVDAGCPDVASFRTEAVISSFDPALVKGLWYEHRYKDPAQALASCQTINGTLNGNILKMDFSVRYGLIPFTIQEIYTPVDPPQLGVYSKGVNEPGGQFVKLQTAFVDVKVGADGLYEQFSVYSCISALGLPVEEVIFATRSRVPDEAELDQMMQLALKQGVPFKVESLSKVDHSKCPTAAAPVALSLLV